MIHTSAVIEGRRVTIGYLEGKRETDLFTDMDFTLYRGELTALLGTNGTGKSTLLRTMSATQPYLRGNILLNGRELSSYNERELARHIGVVFTERYMAGGLRVHELVALGRYPYTGFFGRLDENDRLITEAVMEQVGISHKRDTYLSQLSDGERQKAFIAKALAQESDVILLNEPTAFLDLPQPYRNHVAATSPGRRKRENNSYVDTRCRAGTRLGRSVVAALSREWSRMRSNRRYDSRRPTR